MESVNLEGGENPKVHITSVGGDLRLTGRGGTSVEAQAGPRGALSAREVGDGIEIACRSACLVFLPPGALVIADSVGGDVRVTGMSGDLAIGTIGGDLVLRRAGKVTLTRVGGDAVLSRVAGGLSAEWIGGDAVLQQVDGQVRLRSLGGDLVMEGDGRDVEVTAGGDARLRLTPVPGGRCVAHAGGDLACRLPDEASARLVLKAGGDLDIGAKGVTGRSGEVVTLEMGTAEALIELTSGGDLKVSGAGKWAGADVDLSDQIRSQVEAEMEAALAQVEASLEAIEGGPIGIDTDRLSRDIRRATDRAQRRAVRARVRVESSGRGEGWRDGLPRGEAFENASPAAKADASEQERLTVLRMLEQGTISVDEAEKLLQALEPGA